MEEEEEEDDMRSSVESCFHNWIAQQRTDLEELIEALMSTPYDETRLHFLTQKSINLVENYHRARSILAQQHAPSLFVSPWSTPFENSFLWIGGLRPANYIRLVNSQSQSAGIELEAHLSCRLLHSEKKSKFFKSQLSFIHSLRRETVREEDHLSTRMEALQEHIADGPLLMIANNSNQVGESSHVVDQAMVAHDLALAQILKDADNLRLTILKELIGILTPSQAVNLLVALNSRQLSVHEFGIRDDQHPGNF